MKSIKILFTVALLACTLGIQAQSASQKIGYAEWDYIFSQLPEYKQIDNELKSHSAQLESQLKSKYTEYETKLKAYQNMPATTPDAVRADKERELQGLQEGIQKFQQEAETSVRTKQNTMMEPVFTKVGKAIEDVAKENGYTFIINPQLIGGGDILLYSDEQYNVSDLVLKKLGITPPAPAASKTK